MITLASLFFAGVTVTLPSEVNVRGLELFVGDVATVQGDDPAEVARVEAVSLGYAPAPGQARTLRPERIERIIQSVIRDVDVEIAAAGVLRVTPVTEKVTGASIEAAARAAIERELAGDDGPAADLSADLSPDLSIRAAAPTHDLEIPAGIEGYALDAQLVSFARRSGLLRVPVRVRVDGSLHRTVWTSWQVDFFETLPVLAGPIRAGATIEAAMLIDARLPVSGQVVALSRRSLVGTTAKHDLSAGQPITDHDVERPMLVERGDRVVLEVRKGRVSVRVLATAKQSGRLGDSVLIEVANGTRTPPRRRGEDVSGRVLSATIISKKQVTIDLTTKG